jgi:hypothetical protein
LLALASMNIRPRKLSTSATLSELSRPQAACR